MISYYVSYFNAAYWEGTRVAVKFLASPTLDASSAVLREALLTRDLNHKNIVRVFSSRVAYFNKDSLLDAISGE